MSTRMRASSTARTRVASIAVSLRRCCWRAFRCLIPAGSTRRTPRWPSCGRTRQDPSQPRRSIAWWASAGTPIRCSAAAAGSSAISRTSSSRSRSAKTTSRSRTGADGCLPKRRSTSPGPPSKSQPGPRAPDRSQNRLNSSSRSAKTRRPRVPSAASPTTAIRRRPSHAGSRTRSWRSLRHPRHSVPPSSGHAVSWPPRKSSGRTRQARAIHERFLGAPKLRLIPDPGVVRQTIIKAVSARKLVGVEAQAASLTEVERELSFVRCALRQCPEYALRDLERFHRVGCQVARSAPEGVSPWAQFDKVAGGEK